MVYLKSNGRQLKAESQSIGEADFLQDTLPTENIITVLPVALSCGLCPYSEACCSTPTSWPGTLRQLLHLQHEGLTSNTKWRKKRTCCHHPLSTEQDHLNAALLWYLLHSGDQTPSLPFSLAATSILVSCLAQPAFIQAEISFRQYLNPDYHQKQLISHCSEFWFTLFVYKVCQKMWGGIVFEMQYILMFTC